MKLLNTKLSLLGLLLFFPFLGVHGYFLLVGSQSIGFVFFVLYLVLFSFYLVLNKDEIIIYRVGSSSVVFLMILITAGYIQYLYYGNMTIGQSPPVFVPCVLVLVYVIISTLNKRLTESEILKFIFYSYLFFFAISIALYILGFSFTGDATFSEGFVRNVLAPIDRGSLPLYAHPVETTEGGALALIISIILLKNYKYSFYQKTIFICMFFGGLYGVFLGGARAGVLGVVVALILLGTKLYKVNKVTGFILFSLVSFPFWYTAVTNIIIESQVLNALEFVSRTGDLAEVISLNNRTIIWLNTFQIYIENIDFFHLIFGYGFGGQSPSGVASSYAYIFGFHSSDPGFATMHVHNSVLQSLINYGILGLLLYAYIIFKLFRVFCLNELYELNVLLILIILLGCTGVSAIIFSYAFMFLFLIMVLYIKKPSLIMGKKYAPFIIKV